MKENGTAVLISIRPQWCRLIASGKKTVEVRKTKPKLNTPFKVYIYCTLGDLLPYSAYCGYDMADYRNDFSANGKVIGEFICDWIEQATVWNRKFISSASCLSLQDLYHYAGDKSVNELFGWHISDLVIYDKPVSLNSFYRECAGLYNTGLCWECEKAVGDEYDCATNGRNSFSRPPQSWCYVEELKNGI